MRLLEILRDVTSRSEREACLNQWLQSVYRKWSEAPRVDAEGERQVFEELLQGLKTELGEAVEHYGKWSREVHREERKLEELREKEHRAKYLQEIRRVFLELHDRYYT